MIVLFRRYRLSGRIKKRGTGESLVPATYVLQHDIDGFCAGVDPGNRSPGSAFSEASPAQGGSTALRFNGLLKGKSLKVSRAVPGRLHVAGLLARQLTNRFLREVAYTSEFPAVEKHLVPGEQVLDGGEEAAIHRKIMAVAKVPPFNGFPFAVLEFAMKRDGPVFGTFLIVK